MKNVKIDSETCIGCGLCVNMCPEAFLMDDEGGYAKFEMPEGGNCGCDFDEIANQCPVGAISTEE